MKRSLAFSLLSTTLLAKTPLFDVDVADSTRATKFTCAGAPTVRPNVEFIGDINGDGITDYALTAPSLNSNDGLVALIYGGQTLPSGFDYCTFTDKTYGYRIKGEASGAADFGYLVKPVGDLNGDGTADLIVAANKWDTDKGRLYGIYLPKEPTSEEYKCEDLPRYTITGDTGNLLGSSLVDAGDQNGDGFKDFIVGGDNFAMVAFSQGSMSGDIAATTAAMTTARGLLLTVSPAEVAFGGAVTKAGDLNGDGKDDFLITSPDTADNKIHVYYGTFGTPSSNTAVISAANGNGFAIAVGPTGLKTGTAPQVADLDEDGILDVIVPLADNNVYVLYGHSIHSVTTIESINSLQGFKFIQTTPSATFASAIAVSANWNGFGKDNVLISDTTSGVIYVVYANHNVFGRSNGINVFNVDNMAGNQGFKISNTASANVFGTVITANMDANGDGLNDILISNEDASSSIPYLVISECYGGNICWDRRLTGGQIVGIIIGSILGAVVIFGGIAAWLYKTGRIGGKSKGFKKGAQAIPDAASPTNENIVTTPNNV